MPSLLHAPDFCLAGSALVTFCLCLGGRKASVKRAEGTSKIMSFDCMLCFDGSVLSVCHIMAILPCFKITSDKD